MMMMMMMEAGIGQPRRGFADQLGRIKPSNVQVFGDSATVNCGKLSPIGDKNNDAVAPIRLGRRF